MRLNEVCGGCGLKVKKEHAVHKPGEQVTYVDPCLGKLPGVMYACCGHGKDDESGYLFFETGVIIRMDVEVVEHQTFNHNHRFNEETTTPRKTN